MEIFHLDVMNSATDGWRMSARAEVGGGDRALRAWAYVSAEGAAGSPAVRQVWT